MIITQNSSTELSSLPGQDYVFSASGDFGGGSLLLQWSDGTEWVTFADCRLTIDTTRTITAPTSKLRLLVEDATNPSISANVLPAGHQNVQDILSQIPNFTGPAYLMASFWSGEDKLRFYASTDTFTWYPLGEVIYTDDEGGVRDPSIIKINGVYYISFTAGTFGNTSFFKIIKSVDLKNWSVVTKVSTASVGAVTQTWMGNFYQEDGKVYILANLSTDNASTMSPYLIQATSDDLSTWGPPTLLLGTNFPSQTIAQQIIKIGSTYKLWLKNDNTDYEEIWTSSSLASGYTALKTGDFAGWGNTLEGGVWINTGGPNYTVLVDYYTGEGIYYATSTDAGENWSALSFANQGTIASSNPSVLKISDQQDFTNIIGLLSIPSAAEVAPPQGHGAATLDAHWLGASALKSAVACQTSPGNAQGLQFFSNVKMTGLALSLIDSTKPGWWIEVSVGSDDSICFYHCPAGSVSFDLMFKVNSSASICFPAGNFIRSGVGSPESFVSAPVGSLYLRTDGGANTTFYVKQTGNGNTGWSAK